jgi:KDO2-lipid IV(A) lauroyltransferase
MSYYLYSFAWRVIRFLPESMAYRLGDWIARSAIKRDGRRVRRLRSNLQVVMSQSSNREIEDLLERAMRSNLRYWIDTFRFPGWNAARIRESVTVINREVFDEAMASGRGLIVALPHAGNWDHAGAFFCAEGFPLVTVAEHLKPERLFRRFLSYREAMGMEVLDLDARVMKTLETRLREGRLIALVADRDLSASGIEVRFFQRVAKFPAGPAKLAIDTGATLVTAYIRYLNDGIEVRFSDPLLTAGKSVADVVQAIASNFEAEIGRYPEDWHMLQRVFLEDSR